MDMLIPVLRGAEQLASAIPVPYLGDAVSVALKLAELVQDVKDTKEECRALADRAVTYTLAIYDALKGCELALDGEKKGADVQQLLGVLTRIQQKMERREKKDKGWKGFVKMIPRLLGVKAELKELSTELDRALELFHLQRDVLEIERGNVLARVLLHLQQHSQDSAHAHDTIIKEVRLNRTIMQELHKAEEEAMKYQLNKRDVELIEELQEDDEITRDTVLCASSEQSTPVWYRGKLRGGGGSPGTVVVVKQYEKKHDWFMAEVERAKRRWHPNVTHFVGYCPDENGPFIAYILADHVGSFDMMSRTVRGVEKFLWVIKAAKQILAGLNYLAAQSASMSWTPDDDIDIITGGSDLIVTDCSPTEDNATANSRVLVDVSRCSLKRLPNLVALYDLTIGLNSKTRGLIKGVKKDPLANVAPHKRRAALCKLWRQFWRVVDSDFSRTDTLLWPSRRIVCPGECFLLSSKEVLDGLCYEDQLRHRTLASNYYPAWLIFSPPVDKAATRAEKRKAKKLRERQRPREVEAVELVHQIPQADLRCDPSSSSEYVALQRWRRYTVHGLESGWRVHTMTAVRESGDCPGWLIEQATRLRDLPLDYADLSMATALKFTTQTYVVDMFDKSGKAKPPPTLYFFERVHDNPRASLDVDGRLDWPWGYWSTVPDDFLEIERAQDAHRARGHSIAYVGAVEEGTYRWMQIVEDCLMHIDVRVEVEYCKYTPDECVLLEEIQEAAIVEYEYEPDRWMVPHGPEEESDMEDLWEEEEVRRNEPSAWRYEREAEEDRRRERCDPHRVAEGLFWLRVDKKRRGVYTWEQWCRRVRAAYAARLMRAAHAQGVPGTSHGRTKAHRKRAALRGHRPRMSL
ncbi:hypothetical protein FKP32DRAFT_1590950 [Trametes sanguinea]|nr:hypothetical protein FKP32DRAFT_1590950 [Trametes sanguinea]